VEEGIVANGRDVSERRAAEEALRHATEAAERANQAKSEFLSRMSHELRTPMNSILGFAQVLEAEQLPERQDRCVQHILRAGQHLLQLINEVLEISRIEAGRHNLSLEPVRVGAVLHEAIGLARPMATQAHVELEYAAFAHEELYVRADRQRLSQVMLNLISNAIKYNRAGGRVKVSCELTPGGGADGDGAERHPTTAPASRLWIRVEDTGRGIPAHKRADLFTPFARLGAENSDVEGTGLGLALSQRLAEAMGGGLALERTGPQGSVFRVELTLSDSPLRDQEEKGSAPRVRAPASHAPATLLYVEDNLANLALVETILWERPNWRTIPALQGQLGAELAREHMPDLILLDLHLPDMCGDEVLARLRADARTAKIPVVMVSADATPATSERLLRAGAAAFLTKPINVTEFLETVERLLPRGAGGGGAPDGASPAPSLPRAVTP
jgi:signal transduction histidine kinase/CheY-like chemotaxis protein